MFEKETLLLSKRKQKNLATHQHYSKINRNPNLRKREN